MSLSVSQSSPDFGRVVLRPGLTECLCLECLAVIGRASTEQALAAVEKAHLCIYQKPASQPLDWRWE